MEMPAKFAVQVQINRRMVNRQVRTQFIRRSGGRHLGDVRIVAVQPGNRSLPQRNDQAKSRGDQAREIHSARFRVVVHVGGSSGDNALSLHCTKKGAHPFGYGV